MSAGRAPLGALTVGYRWDCQVVRPTSFRTVTSRRPFSLTEGRAFARLGDTCSLRVEKPSSRRLSFLQATRCCVAVAIGLFELVLAATLLALGWDASAGAALALALWMLGSCVRPGE
jgi:hypothetical protein